MTYDLRKDFGAAPNGKSYKSFQDWFKSELDKRSRRGKLVTLRVGTKIKIRKVPAGDLRSEKREKKKGLKDAGWTAEVIRAIIKENKPVKIEEIDEYGNPWFRARIKRNGRTEEHYLAVMETESWQVISK